MSENKRIANFTYQEKECLMRLVNKYGKILEDKQTNRVSIEEKNRIWKKIETEFNNNAPIICHRNAEQLKRLYVNKKKELRKKLAEQKKETYLTGGGPPPPELKVDPIDELLIQVINEKSVRGFTAEFDSDSKVEPATPASKKIRYSFDDESKDAEEQIYEFSPAEFEFENNILIDLNVEENVNKTHLVNSSRKFPPSNLDKPIHNKLRVEPSCSTTVEQWTPTQTTATPTNELKKTTLRTNRRRPTGGVKVLTSSDVGEKYNCLLDKRLSLIEKQLEQAMETQHFMKEEQKQKMENLKVEKENLILDKEEKKLRIELLKIELEQKKSAYFQ